jgi:hypothetical protein
MRPQYETAATQRAEREIADRFAKARGFSLRKMSPAYHLDFALISRQWGPWGCVHGFLEAKDRPKLAFGFGGPQSGYLLSSLKVSCGREMASRFSKPAFLVTELYRHLPDLLVWFGREDRQDSFDNEPCVVYPWDVFVRLT